MSTFKTNAFEIWQIFVCRGEHEITEGAIDQVITRLLKKADRIRSKMKKPGDRAIRLSNKLIMQAEILTNLFHLARHAPNKWKKAYNFKGDL